MSDDDTLAKAGLGIWGAQEGEGSVLAEAIRAVDRQWRMMNYKVQTHPDLDERALQHLGNQRTERMKR